MVNWKCGLSIFLLPEKFFFVFFANWYEMCYENFCIPCKIAKITSLDPGKGDVDRGFFMYSHGSVHLYCHTSFLIINDYSLTERRHYNKRFILILLKW